MASNFYAIAYHYNAPQFAGFNPGRSQVKKKYAVITAATAPVKSASKAYPAA